MGGGWDWLGKGGEGGSILHVLWIHGSARSLKHGAGVFVNGVRITSGLARRVKAMNKHCGPVR